MKKKFRSLKFKEKCFVLLLWVQLIIIDLRLKIIPPSLNKKWIYNYKTDKNKQNIDKAKIQKIVNYVNIAAAHSYFFNMSCLSKALIMRRLLKKSKINSNILFGLKKNYITNKYDAHAWVDINGYNINLSNDQRGYQEFKNL